MRSASESCLCPFERGSYASGHSFHAYDPSEPSPCDHLTRTLQEGAGKGIKSSCTEVCGANDSSLSIQITHTIAQIELLDSQLNSVEAEVTEIMKFYDSVLMTIPGMGYINGGMIFGEIGDIHRFSSPGKLLAFAGLAPSVYP